MSQISTVVYGDSGDGKSTTNNVILGEKAFEESSSPWSCTHSSKTSSNDGFRCTDCRGTNDTDVPFEKNIDLLLRSICALIQVHFFNFIVKGRWGASVKKNLKIFLEFFGPSAFLKNTIIVQTHFNEFDDVSKFSKMKSDIAKVVKDVTGLDFPVDRIVCVEYGDENKRRKCRLLLRVLMQRLNVQPYTMPRGGAIEEGLRRVLMKFSEKFRREELERKRKIEEEARRAQEEERRRREEEIRRQNEIRERARLEAAAAEARRKKAEADRKAAAEAARRRQAEIQMRRMMQIQRMMMNRSFF